MRKAVFITVRSASRRLPQKCFVDIEGMTAITHLIRRLKASVLEWLILCTTTSDADRQLVDIAKAEGIYYFQGPVDKLVRWRQAARHFSIDFFVTADGDDLLAEPELINGILAQYEQTGADFIMPPKDIICGAIGYGIKTSALEKVCRIKNTRNTEMMWVYFTETGMFRCEEAIVPKIFLNPDIRATLDYPEDLQFFRAIFSRLYKQHGMLSLRQVIEFLNHHPEIQGINRDCIAKFKENQRKKTRLVIKNEFISKIK